MTRAIKPDRSPGPLRWGWLAAAAVTLMIGGGLWLLLETRADLKPLPSDLGDALRSAGKTVITDRHGTPLRTTRQTKWNVWDIAALHEIPAMLKNAVILAEDQRFFSHGGVDWLARLHAVRQNLMAFRAVRGASTLTEQVVRMLHPRPRTLWSRWIEGIEASGLEKRFSKGEILAFYLNQVPYAANRRGVVQASRYYFNRDPDTLTPAESLSLAVLIRSPSRLDLHRDVEISRPAIQHLAARMARAGWISGQIREEIETAAITLTRSGALAVTAPHFVRYVEEMAIHTPLAMGEPRVTTLDGPLQSAVTDILNTQISRMSPYGVQNGAVIVVDHGHGNEVLAWVNDLPPDGDLDQRWIDAARVPRQPGSTLKPFLYALAIEKGWTAATWIDDRPLAEPVGTGLHAFRNYSRVHYGPVTLRKALGNSLNIPAVRALKFVGPDTFLNRLRAMGIDTLTEHPDHYGDGLALGNGEIPLVDLTEAYTTLARNGLHARLTVFMRDAMGPERNRRIFSPGIAKLMGNILSDPEARKPEFTGDLLTFPARTAVKTGTSSDYRDSWAFGYDAEFTVGVWMGNLSAEPMDGVNGSRGAATVLRGVFSELGRRFGVRGLAAVAPPDLTPQRICIETGTADNGRCASRDEWFLPGTGPSGLGIAARTDPEPIRIESPSPGLHMAEDPRIPDNLERFTFSLNRVPPTGPVTWIVDGLPVGASENGAFQWPLMVGHHRVQASWSSGGPDGRRSTGTVGFVVK